MIGDRFLTVSLVALPWVVLVLASVLVRRRRGQSILRPALPDALHVGLHFPFNLAFLGDIYRLEQRVDVRDVRAVESTRSRLGRRTVRVRFARPEGDEEAIELQVADPGRLAAALAAVRERVK